MELRYAAAVRAERIGAVDQLPHGTRQDAPSRFGDADRACGGTVRGHDRCRLDLRRHLDEIRESSRRIHDSDGIRAAPREQWLCRRAEASTVPPESPRCRLPVRGHPTSRARRDSSPTAGRISRRWSPTSRFSRSCPSSSSRLSLLGLAHRAEASDFFIRELKHAFPGTSPQQHHQARPPRAGQRGGTRDHRRHRPDLVVVVVLQRAGVRAQHRLRAAEPALPAREAAGGRARIRASS